MNAVDTVIPLQSALSQPSSVLLKHHSPKSWCCYGWFKQKRLFFKGIVVILQMTCTFALCTSPVSALRSALCLLRIPIPTLANVINYIWTGQIYESLNICFHKHGENKSNVAQRCICKIHKPLHEDIYVGIVCDLLTYVVAWFCNCTSFLFI